VEFQAVGVFLDAQARKLQEDPAKIRFDHLRDYDLSHVALRATIKETRSAIEATKREFQARLEAIEARTEHGRGPGVCAYTVQPTTFDGATSWAVFRLQFETVAERTHWSHLDKSMYLNTALKWRTADVLQGIPTNATYEETLQDLEDRFGDQHFSAAYRCQLTTRTRKAGESLKNFSTAIEQLDHRAYPTLPEDHILREAGKAFAYGVEDPDIKIQLLLEEKRL
jgi:hypothetical protein